MKSKNSDARAPENAWTFLTNHAHVLLCLAEKPDMLLRQVAATVGITERAVQKIVADLETAFSAQGLQGDVTAFVEMAGKQRWLVWD